MTHSMIPTDVLLSAQRMADNRECLVYVGRVKETLYTARGDQFLVRRDPQGIGVYYVLLGERWS